MIRQFTADGAIVITAGGDDILVVRDGSRYRGIEGVIDKDLSSAMVALQMNADILIVLTGAEQVAIDRNKPDQRNLSELSVSAAKKLLAEGQFPKGSIGPKIEAVIKFIEGGGKEALITSIEKLNEALDGKTGTRITK